MLLQTSAITAATVGSVADLALYNRWRRRQPLTEKKRECQSVASPLADYLARRRVLLRVPVRIRGLASKAATLQHRTRRTDAQHGEENQGARLPLGSSMCESKKTRRDEVHTR